MSKPRKWSTAWAAAATDDVLREAHTKAQDNLRKANNMRFLTVELDWENRIAIIQAELTRRLGHRFPENR